MALGENVGNWRDTELSGWAFMDLPVYAKFRVYSHDDEIGVIAPGRADLGLQAMLHVEGKWLVRLSDDHREGDHRAPVPNFKWLKPQGWDSSLHFLTRGQTKNWEQRIEEATKWPIAMF